ncbi:hypothetical protein ACAG65_01765 [Halodesulfovibrio aestuarii]|uniref:hypothetical protein n=1 Tax=Halodesulfovibrio aestuarii TaxID=126333 RepID=UPI0035216865
MFRYTSKHCKQCYLQEDPFHNITINTQGLCNLCENSTLTPERNWEKRQKQFEEIIAKRDRSAQYDGLIMMSGGKDSAYMAHMLTQKYGLNLLALTIDNGFEYPETFENASTIAKKLDMAQLVYRINPKLMQEYYKFLFCNPAIQQKDCGQVCTFCGRFLVRTATELAANMGIPLVFSGHNPEQIFLMGESIEEDPDRITMMEFTMALVQEDTATAVKAWEKAHSANRTGQLLFPLKLSADNVSLVFPFQYFPYEPDKMRETVQRKLNWLPIKRFSKTYIASGCKLVKLWAYLAHCNETNNYVDFEFSTQVREGTIPLSTIKNFYTESAADLDELAELTHDLNMAVSLQEMLSSHFGKENELYKKLAS